MLKFPLVLLWSRTTLQICLECGFFAELDTMYSVRHNFIDVWCQFSIDVTEESLFASINLDTKARGGEPRMQKLSASLVRAQGYQRFPLFKPVVGRNIALHAVHALGLLPT